ncbi:MAG: SDR family oxidoreductase [Bryobacteraceae bacterium]|nr:SDR family oxidoreductase [Bryobacteraceae bacterium]
MKNQKIAFAAAGLVAAGIVSAVVSRRRSGPRLAGQVALITGSSRGLGFQLAREFAREGCRVVICARDGQELERARQDLAGRGAEVLALLCDVSNRADVERLFERVRSQWDSVDILVNNAGVIQVGPIESMRVEDFEQTMAIMFWGTLYPTLAVLPEMLERKSGRIVNITSIGAKVSVPHLVPYSCAKSAALALSEGLRAEVAGKGVYVISIVPGLMRTGSYQQALFKGKQQEEYEWFSLGATLPGISMSAERAARQIVEATIRGDAERILSTPANLLARFKGLFPSLTTKILALVNAMVLPEGEGTEQGDPSRGKEVHAGIRSQVLDLIHTLGRLAGERLNQEPVTSGR